MQNEGGKWGCLFLFLTQGTFEKFTDKEMLFLGCF